jgi:proline iminopeptidase
MLEAILYPSIEPYSSGRLKVSELHELYYEEVGNPKGVPVVFLHGGPGGGVNETYRRFFDPKYYRVILFDQRGAGKSTPHAELKDNSTWHLVEDIEKLRGHLGIDRWIVFGGSWGSTLALIYAESHPQAVGALCLRGIFLCRRHELLWFYQEGASRVFPEAFDKYLEVIPLEERKDLISAYYKRLTSDDPKLRLEAARAWSVWEASTSKLSPDQNLMDQFGEDLFALAFARIECHYFMNRIFLETDDWILKNASRLHSIPTQIVHGRYDMVCPVENAWDLKKALPDAKLHIIPDAGHSALENSIAQKLVAIMDEWRALKI